MTHRLRNPTRGAGLVLLALAAALAGCRRDSSQRAAPSTPPIELSAVKPRQHPPLPEDAELGRKSTEQWQEHEEEEEHNRRLCYDHERRAQHRAVAASLERLRKQYARARSKSDLLRARALGEHESAALRKQLDDIDPWQNSSLLVADYDAVLELLAQPYPTAKLAALSGDATELGKLETELDRHASTIREKLAASEECEEED